MALLISFVTINREIAFIISLRTEQMIFVLPACDFANIVLKRLTVNQNIVFDYLFISSHKPV